MHGRPRTMLRKLLIYPPLAFARLGNCRTPLEAFSWGPNDNTPRGTGKTTILPASTMALADDGTLSPKTPVRVRFKDNVGLRPVCPFFELYGEWDRGDLRELHDDSSEGP